MSVLDVTPTFRSPYAHAPARNVLPSVTKDDTPVDQWAYERGHHRTTSLLYQSLREADWNHPTITNPTLTDILPALPVLDREPLSAAPFTTRTLNILEKQQTFTWGSLGTWTRSQVENSPGMGVNSLDNFYHTVSVKYLEMLLDPHPVKQPLQAWCAYVGRGKWEPHEHIQVVLDEIADTFPVHDNTTPLVSDLALLTSQPTKSFTPTEFMNYVLEELGDRQWNILQRRVFAPVKMSTLNEMGNEYGVTRELIRQQQKTAAQKLRSLLETQQGASVRAHVDLVHRFAGSAFPSDNCPYLIEQINRVSDEPLTTTDSYHLFVLWAAGYTYDKVSRWWKLPEFENAVRTIKTDVGHVLTPTQTLSQTLHHNYPIRGRYLARFLQEVIGLKEGPIGWFDPSTPSVDRAIAVLRFHETPLTIDELETHVGHLARDFMLNDDRVHRSTRTRIALREWELPEYSSITKLLTELIETYGPVTHVQASDMLCEKWEVSPASVRSYLTSAPMFIRNGDDDTYRLRRPDEPYELDISQPEAWTNVKRIAHGVHELRVTLDEHMLRGVSIHVPVGLAATAGVTPGKEHVFVVTNEIEGYSSYRLWWLDTSSIGPNGQTVRAPAEHWNLTDGDNLYVVFNTHRNTVTFNPSSLFDELGN